MATIVGFTDVFEDLILKHVFTQNDLVIINDSRVLVYNYDGTIQSATNIGLTTNPNSRYISCGDFLQNNSYNELIFHEGVFEFDGISWYLNTDLSLNTTTSGQLLPVRLRNVNNDIDNLIFWNSNKLEFFITSATTNCGDGVCDIGENQFSCASDCVLGGGGLSWNETIGNLVFGDQCIDDTWCVSGICGTNGKCEGRVEGSNCTSDSQCSSGDCNPQYLCTQQEFDISVNNFLCTIGMCKSKSKIFLGLVLIIVASLIGASIGTVLGAGIGFIIGVLMSTMVFGWLGIWFLFAFFLVITILLLVLYLFGGMGNN
jgi:hypothetical protein